MSIPYTHTPRTNGETIDADHVNDLGETLELLGTMATQAASAVAITGGTIAGITAFTAEGAIVLDADSTGAVVIRKEDNTGVLVVDTTNKEVEARNATKVRGFSDDGTTETFSLDGANGNAQFDGTLAVGGNATLGDADTDVHTVRGHLVADAAGTDPGIVVGAGAGTGGSVGISNVSGSDMSFRFRVTTGSGGTAAGVLATVTFAQAFGAIPNGIFVQPRNANAAGIGLHLTSIAAGSFNLSCTAVPTTGTNYDVGILVIG